jgi:hypothetical protein
VADDALIDANNDAVVALVEELIGVFRVFREWTVLAFHVVARSGAADHLLHEGIGRVIWGENFVPHRAIFFAIGHPNLLRHKNAFRDAKGLNNDPVIEAR